MKYQVDYKKWEKRFVFKKMVLICCVCYVGSLGLAKPQVEESQY